MDLILDIIFAWALGILGVLFYALRKLYSKILADKKFDIKKLWNENKIFWVVVLSLNLVIAVILKVVPEAEDFVSLLVNVEKTNLGYLLIGYSLAGGTNSAPVTGKRIQEKLPETEEE